jgi:type I restriction enzyme, S subunit
MNNIKKSNIPVLRFPGFEGEWINEQLDSIAKFAKGKGVSKSEIVEDGKYECIRYGELYTHYNEVISEVISRTDVGENNLVFSDANDIIIPASGETQIDIATASCVTRKGIALGGDLNIIKTDKNGVFLSYYFNNRLKYKIARLSQGISVVHLYSSQLKLLKLNLPTLPEQQKIATFFTSIDKKIELLKKKHEKLEQYKKGVMQKIFSQEIRFKIENPDGELVEPPDWEEKKLGEVFNQRNEKGFNDFELLSVTMHDGVKKRIDIDSKDNSSNNKSNYKKVIKEDIVYNSMRMWQGASGVSSYIGIVSPAYTVLAKNNMNNSYYFGYLFKTQTMIQIFQRNSQGLTSDTWNLKYPQLSTIKINIPCIQEQTKIANFLSSIDKKIEKIQLQIDKAEDWKKGLLGRMFC